MDVCGKLEQIPSRRCWDVTFTGVRGTDGQPENKPASGRVCRGSIKNVSFKKIKPRASASLLCVNVCAWLLFSPPTPSVILSAVLLDQSAAQRSHANQKRKERRAGMLMSTCLSMWGKWKQIKMNFASPRVCRFTNTKTMPCHLFSVLSCLRTVTSSAAVSSLITVCLFKTDFWTVTSVFAWSQTISVALFIPY